MNVSPAVNLPLKTSLSNITMIPTILGPFETVLRWSGLDLSRAFVARSGWVKTICMVAVCFLICLLMFFVSLTLLLDSSKPLTLEWATSCIWGFMSLHGFGSALCVISWTRSQFLPKFQDTLAKVQNQRGPLYDNGDCARIYRRIVIATAFFISTWIFSSMKGVLYEGFRANSSMPFTASYPFTLSTMYGLNPIIYLAIGFSSALALVIHVLILAHVNREWASFNGDLVNTVRLQQIATPGILNSFSTRQLELLKMVKFVSRKTEVFVSVSTIFAALTAANSLYVMAGFDNEASVVMKVLGFLWMNCSMTLLLATNKQPAQTQVEIKNTAQILLDSDFCQNSRDDQVWKTYRCMIDRALHYQTKMYFMQAFVIDQHFMHKILFIAPNVGSLLVIIRKMGLD